MTKAQQLQKLNKKIKRCKKCPLWKNTKNAVPGEGPTTARIMFVGEAPGREEDLSGRPFIGRAGKLLTQLMEKNGIKRERVFITSILKCRPPKNRQPAGEEIAACLPYLLEQIDIVNPQKVILLGGVAFSIFFPKQKLSDLRGRLIKKEGRQFFITYHPAAGLRFLKIKKILEKDFQLI
jgi:DNA polymerase